MIYNDIHVYVKVMAIINVCIGLSLYLLLYFEMFILINYLLQLKVFYFRMDVHTVLSATKRLT